MQYWGKTTTGPEIEYQQFSRSAFNVLFEHSQYIFLVFHSLPFNSLKNFERYSRSTYPNTAETQRVLSGEKGRTPESLREAVLEREVRAVSPAWVSNRAEWAPSSQNWQQPTGPGQGANGQAQGTESRSLAKTATFPGYVTEL